MVPIPPCKPRQALCYIPRKPALDRPRGIATDNRVRGDILGDDCARGHYRTDADPSPGQYDCTVPYPDIVADIDPMALPPIEELRLVGLAGEIGAGAIGEMRLCCPVHRMVARIDPRHGGNGAEFSDRGVSDLGVVDDI